MYDLSLSMMITNTKYLESGTSPKKQWPQAGGSIGSSYADDWKLKDSQNKVHPMHCEIIIVDGAYCLKDTSGDTFINGSSMPIGKNDLAKLCHKDEIHVGPFNIRVSLVEANKEMESSESLDQLIPSRERGLLDNGDADLITHQDHQGVADPLLALDEMMGQPEDPERLIKHEVINEKNESALHSVDLGERAASISTQQSDSENVTASSIGLKRIIGFGRTLSNKVHSHFESDHRNNTKNNVSTKPEQTTQGTEGYGMDNNVLDLLEEEVAKSMTPSSRKSSEAGTSSHLLTGPMMNGMGVDLGDTEDMEKMHMLSQELGESLRSCIEGLLELHKQIDSGHFGVMNRSLQPIEDNPLRLGLDYQDTIKTMYEADKSLVHLSAPAAISESLKNIRDHNDAVQHATGEALQQILAAFSPQVLLRRFNSYKRGQDSEQTNHDSWAWNMYCSYYKELTSSRQKGFEKLFWQIFEQAYDKKIREKQLEF
ncbi:type VI secretion system-associated FHA domain protein TagH [Vibrio viridaestus]|uniref:Type VI secretion system-associated FHA domain protein TagH n=1 Tax=Vibrio viridaestus TaxID=2487322 RepID=A0A3N9TN44_9VIBR|nr:type VI secretion system-associated FHA domain protein TagH [Vibrio viridaestus]RQW65075.1 type VI secretion system-associated FHA domain protein TagH [Vibrio viridaestus]